MTEELKVKKRSKFRGSWIETMLGIDPEVEKIEKEKENILVAEEPETRAIDFVRDPRHSIETKLGILAACIDILNDEVQKMKEGEPKNANGEIDGYDRRRQCFKKVT